MIIKVKIGKTFKGCVRYVLHKEGATVLDTHHVADRVVKHIVQDFEIICSQKPSIKNVVWHTSVSFAHQDQVSDELMRQISKDYLEAMGLSNNQYIMVKHVDKPHAHFHLVINRIGLDLSVADDSWCKNRSAQVSDQLEQKYSLTVASQVGRKYSPSLENPRERKDKAKQEVKNYIKKSIDECFQEGVHSIELLEERLKKKKIEMIIQKRNDGTLNGVSFRAHDFAFKGSSIHKDYRAKAIIAKLSVRKKNKLNMIKL